MIKLYSIGEIMKRTKISRKTISNYTLMGLISSPKRTKSGQRFYSVDVFQKLEIISRFKKKGYTLPEIKAVFMIPD